VSATWNGTPATGTPPPTVTVAVPANVATPATPPVATAPSTLTSEAPCKTAWNAPAAEPSAAVSTA